MQTTCTLRTITTSESIDKPCLHVTASWYAYLDTLGVCPVALQIR